jgi:Phage ABA sandwich domain
MNETQLRELDTWIAEHVMGMIKADSPDDTGWFRRSTYLPKFEPSTDPAAAMMVLEALRGRGGFCVELIANTDGWLVHYDDDGNGWSVTAETLPLCIALFARKLFENNPLTPEQKPIE